MKYDAALGLYMHPETELRRVNGLRVEVLGAAFTNVRRRIAKVASEGPRLVGLQQVAAEHSASLVLDLDVYSTLSLVGLNDYVAL